MLRDGRPTRPAWDRGGRRPGRLQTTDAEFARAILHGGPIEPDFEEGVRYMEFTEAIAISAHTGEAVTLPPEPMMGAWGQPLG